MSRNPLRRALAAVVAAAVLCCGPSLFGGPFATAQVAPDLHVSVTFDDRAYVNGEEVQLRFTVTNTGGPATAVTGSSPFVPGFFLPFSEWEDLDPIGPGVTLGTGESRVIDLTGSLQGATGDVALRLGVNLGEPDATPEDNFADLTISVVPPEVTDTVDGVLFGDRDGDEQADPGEGLAGATITLQGFGSPDPLRTTTGPDGRFAFQDVPAGRYVLVGSDLPGGSLVAQRLIVVNGQGSATGLLMAAQRPLRETLHASIRFELDQYQPGAVARMRLRLSNSGTSPISGIIAGCNRGGEGPHIEPGAGWEQFEFGVGVTIAPGETKVFRLSGTVPQSAVEFGAVLVACDFGPADDELIEGFPFTQDVARVPAPLVDNRGLLYHDRDGDFIVDLGEGVANLRVALVDLVSRDVAATARTDATGRVLFQNIRPGFYQVRVSGGWEFERPLRIFAGTCFHCQTEWAAQVVPA